jgi:hypothetical protein
MRADLWGAGLVGCGLLTSISLLRYRAVGCEIYTFWLSRAAMHTVGCWLVAVPVRLDTILFDLTTAMALGCKRRLWALTLRSRDEPSYTRSVGYLGADRASCGLPEGILQKFFVYFLLLGFMYGCWRSPTANACIIW